MREQGTAQADITMYVCTKRMYVEVVVLPAFSRVTHVCNAPLGGLARQRARVRSVDRWTIGPTSGPLDRPLDKPLDHWTDLGPLDRPLSHWTDHWTIGPSIGPTIAALEHWTDH